MKRYIAWSNRLDVQGRLSLFERLDIRRRFYRQDQVLRKMLEPAIRCRCPFARVRPSRLKLTIYYERNRRHTRLFTHSSFLCFLHYTVYPPSPDGEMPTDPVISKANFERHLSAVQWQVRYGTHGDKPPHTVPPKLRESAVTCAPPWGNSSLLWRRRRSRSVALVASFLW